MAVQKEKTVKIEGNTVNVRTEIYTSANQVVTDCKNRPVHIRYYDIKSESISKSWCGVESYDEALGLLNNGYQPTVDALKEELKVTPTEGPRISFRNELAGFAPVVPLALKGVPNCMVDMHMKPIKAKVLDVYYDMTASCGKSPEQFLKAGKVLLGAIISLEKQGYRFNLYAVQSYYGRENGRVADFLCVKVKSSDSPIDLKRMSFPLTHPAFFRVIGFDWQGKSPITRDIGYCRGQAIGYNYKMENITNDIIRPIFGNNAFYLSCAKLIDRDYNVDNVKKVFTNAKPAA